MFGLIPPLPHDRFDRNNALGVLLMGALPAVAGSAISFLLGTFFVWGMICIVLGRFPVSLSRTDRLLAGTLTGFWLAVLGTGLVGDNPWEGVVKSAALLPFLSAWVVIPRLRVTRDVDYLTLFSCGAAIGAIAGMLLGLLQAYVLGVRPEGGAGNPGVYSIVSLALATFSTLNITSDVKVRRWLAFAGLLAGLVSVTIAISRGVWLAAIPILILVVVYAPRSWSKLSWRAVATTSVTAIVAVVIFAGHFLAASYGDTVWSYNTLVAGYFTSSPGQRLQMWLASIKAIAESPLWGYGIQNRMAAIASYLPPESETVSGYTHVHNGFLNALVDGGVIVFAFLIAVLTIPIIIAVRASRDQNHRKRLFLAIGLSLVYALCGMTQIMYKHDIMDSFYVFCAIVIAASIPYEKRGPLTETR